MIDVFFVKAETPARQLLSKAHDSKNNVTSQLSACPLGKRDNLCFSSTFEMADRRKKKKKNGAKITKLEHPTKLEAARTI
jgi:hypothetical protein